MSETLIVTKDIDDAGVCRLMMNRPEKHNALNGELVETLSAHLKQIEEEERIRVVVLGGEGPSFCSGADLQWMQSMVDCDEVTNRRDAVRLADLMRTLYSLTKPTIARVQGNAFGGALGLIACCDIAVIDDGAKCAFSEVKLGIIPAVISPYVIAAMGPRQAKRLFLTGEIFTGTDAQRYGLATHCVPAMELDRTVAEQAEALLKGGPRAQGELKVLVHHLTGAPIDVEDYTVDAIARLRVSEEGQEGMKAFLEKRKARWLPKS